MSLARGVIDRLCLNRALQSSLARRLFQEHLSKNKHQSPRYPVLLRFFSRSHPTRGLADAQKAIQKSNDKFKRTEKRVRLACTALALGTVAYQALPNTALLNHVQSIYQQYNGSAPMRVPPDLKALIMEVLEEVIGPDQRAEVKANAFIGYSTEPYLWGSVPGSFQLMLPGTTAYRSQKEFNLSEYRFGAARGNTKLSDVQLESSDVATFKQSVLLTENAKKFVIARELERGKADYPVKMSMLTALNMVTGSVLYDRFVAKFGPAPPSPLVLRTAVLMAHVLFWATLTVLEFDFFRKKTERNIDRGACSHGVGYAQGGIEYYSKVLSRNTALRNLMPNEKGKKLYNLKGEKYPGFIRRKHVSFQERRDICNQALLEHQS